jgi:hypothetical protein
MRRLHHLLLIATLILAAGIATTALAATPVTVTVAVTGDPAPGATVTAKANVTINDGSVLQSVTWKQTGGLPAVLANTATDTVTLTLPDRKTFKDELFTVLEESPIADTAYPAYVPKPAKYESGIQDRFIVAGVSPHSLSDTGAIKFDVVVVTSTGTYHNAVSVAANLPWPTATGNRNVPTLLPVLLHGKTQKTYDWTLTVPTGSTAKLDNAAVQNPEFTPDVAGRYDLTVTDLATNKAVTFTIAAGTWKGIITGQDSQGHPTVDAACTSCHVANTPHFDLFTPWAKSGHAEIFTQNVNTPNGHYGPSCLGCHTVGYNATAVKNNGIDEASDFAGFLASGLMSHGDPLNWSKILTQFPNTARFANIQCENCHGPNDSSAHMRADGSRQSLSSDVCAVCHGEPPRHGRFQQWQLSGHSNYEVARSEGTDPTCGKCHSAQGFVAWSDSSFNAANLNVTWTTENVHPQTCQTCHDPHAEGTTSGDANTNATVRVDGKTPLLMAGFTANNVGSGAICMTCHNGRRGLRDDTQPFVISDATRAPHEGPQADILMGQNLYLTKVGAPGFHSMVEDSCVNCHMEKTAAPSAVSMPGVGTNHTFYADRTICSKCHSNITADSVQGPVLSKMDTLKGEIQNAIKNVMVAQIRLGNAIDLGGQKTLKSASDIAGVEFISSHGRQGVNVNLNSGTKVSDLSLQSVKVVRPAGSPVEIYSVIDPNVAKAGWNYMMVNADKSKGVHNPAFVNSALDVSIFAVKSINAVVANPPAGGGTAIGGGAGNGAGAVSCTSPYVYWAEAVGHAAGVGGSQWRTDLVARNLAAGNASLKFVFHQAGGNLEGTNTISGGGQKAFEDVAALLGATSAIGSLEICSDQPLLVAGRTFNAAASGTFGQNFDGYVADLGYTTGQTVSLIGMRQKADLFRSNLSVTNGGTTEAQVAITLFDASGTSLKTYNLTVPAGLVVQDPEPFRNRAGVPDVDWGFATVTVLKGTNIRTSASLIDSKTNDPSTIPPKQ